jgi:hypothetical protein
MAACSGANPGRRSASSSSRLLAHVIQVKNPTGWSASAWSSRRAPRTNPVVRRGARARIGPNRSRRLPRPIIEKNVWPPTSRRPDQPALPTGRPSYRPAAHSRPALPTGRPSYRPAAHSRRPTAERRADRREADLERARPLSLALEPSRARRQAWRVAIRRWCTSTPPGRSRQKRTGSGSTIRSCSRTDRRHRPTWPTTPT